MATVQEKTKDQDRWNQYGKGRARLVFENPEKYVIGDAYIHGAYADVMELLGAVDGKKIVEFGCGLGRFSVALAKRGAQVVGVDLGPDLINTAQAVATVNQVVCDFRCGNIVDLPFESEQYDLVIGLAILHHLSESDASRAVQEAHRILKPTGRALFLEPVENSKVFDFIQNVIPTGTKGTDWYRPSILQRKAWSEYLKSLDDRSMTDEELLSIGKPLFRTVRKFPYGLLIRLEALFGERYSEKLHKLDEFIFRFCPPLGWLSQMALVEYKK